MDLKHRTYQRSIAAALLCGVLLGSGRTVLAAPASAQASTHDTAQETEDKLFDLSMWVLDNQKDVRNPPNATKEYLDKVLAILERKQPKTITFEDYTSVATENVDVTQKGDWLADVFLKLGPGGKEISNTRIGGDAEIAVYEWKNPDGTSASVTFANGRVIRKTQNGLQ